MFQKLLWLWFITVKRYKLKSAKGRSTKGRVQESSKCGGSSFPLSVESWAPLLSWHQCNDNMYGVLSTVAAHWSLVTRVFIQAPSCRHGWLTTWLISVSGPSWGWADTTWPEAPTLSHLILSFMTIGPRQTDPCQVLCAMGLENCLPEAHGKGQTSLGARLILYYAACL